jgi:hypothetical protein
VVGQSPEDLSQILDFGNRVGEIVQPGAGFNIDPAALDPVGMLAALPPLIKGYLRLGGFVGDGAVIDEQFNTTDVCIVVKTDLVAEKYSRHYERQSKETWAA